MRVGAERLGRVRAEPSVGHRIRDCYWTVSMFTLWQSLLESLCSTTGATQNSKGRHLVSVRWSHNTLCMRVCVITCVCVAILMCFLYIIFFWHTEGRAAPDLCFKKVNEAGDMYGNCGKDLFGKYRSCKDRWRSKTFRFIYSNRSTQSKQPDDTVFVISARDAKCGKIQCLASASKPIENNAVRIETTVSVGNKKIQCMGTHVYKVGQGDEEAQGDTLDPGLVMTGTKCGADSVRLTLTWRYFKWNSLLHALDLCMSFTCQKFCLLWEELSPLNCSFTLLLTPLLLSTDLL